MLGVKILKELSGKNIDTFIYKINKEGVFDKKLYIEFLIACEEFIEKKDILLDRYVDICTECISTLEYILFLFICNFIQSDSYKIKNYPDEICDKDLYEMFFNIRDLSERLVLRVNKF